MHADQRRLDVQGARVLNESGEAGEGLELGGHSVEKWR
jgi:hypothetical protein